MFSKIEGTSSEVNPGHPYENISNFKKYIMRFSGAYQGLRVLGRTLSLGNLKRNLSPMILNRTL